jgi:hypothetical protein
VFQVVQYLVHPTDVLTYTKEDATMSETTATSTAVDVLDTAEAGSAVSQEIRNLATGNVAFYSTLVGDDFATKVATVEAMTNSIPVKENLNKTINVQNIIVQAIAMVDTNSGEVQDQARIILLDADGTAYHAISGGLWRSVQNILGVVGHPSTWPTPLPIHIASVKGRKGDFYTAKIGEAPTKK